MPQSAFRCYDVENKDYKPGGNSTLFTLCKSRVYETEGDVKASTRGPRTLTKPNTAMMNLMEDKLSLGKVEGLPSSKGVAMEEEIAGVDMPSSCIRQRIDVSKTRKRSSECILEISTSCVPNDDIEEMQAKKKKVDSRSSFDGVTGVELGRGYSSCKSAIPIEASDRTYEESSSLLQYPPGSMVALDSPQSTLFFRSRSSSNFIDGGEQSHSRELCDDTDDIYSMMVEALL